MISRQIGATLSVGSGPGVRGLQPVDHRRLALGAKRRRALGALELADRRRDVGAPVEQAEQLAVERVDLPAQRRRDRRGRAAAMRMRAFGAPLLARRPGRRLRRRRAAAPARAAPARRHAEDDADPAVERHQLRVDQRAGISATSFCDEGVAQLGAELLVLLVRPAIRARRAAASARLRSSSPRAPRRSSTARA